MRSFILCLVSLFPLMAVAAQPVAVTLPWAPPSLSQPNGVGFLTMHSPTKDALVRAESDCCRVVELHTHIRDGDVIRMRKVNHIPLPAGEEVTLRPGGYHLMLIGLKNPLKDGDTVPLTLHFKHQASQTVELLVDRQKLLDRLKTSREQNPATTAGDHGAHHDHH